MSRLEDAQPETEIVIRLVLHRDVSRDIAVDHRRQGGDRGVLEQPYRVHSLVYLRIYKM